VNLFSSSSLLLTEHSSTPMTWLWYF